MADVLAVFKYASPAKTLVSALNAKAIPSQYRYEPATDGHVVCLLSEEFSAEAKAMTQRFTQNPNAPEFTEAAWMSGDSVPIGNILSVQTIVKGIRSAPVISVVVLVCSMLYMAVYGMGFVSIYEPLFFQPFDALSTSHQWWRIATPALMHFSVEHLVFNLIWWTWLGRQVEWRMGSLWLIGLAVGIAIASNVAQYWVSGWQFGGMSGIVFGLTGYVWWMQWLKPKLGLTIPIALVGFSLVWMLLGFADVLWIDMANTAHLVGLLVGCCAALCHAKLVNLSSG